MRMRRTVLLITLGIVGAIVRLVVLNPLSIALIGMIWSDYTYKLETKKELNNAYINSGFKDWQEVSFEDAGVSIKLPQEWSIQGEDDLYTLSDANGAPLASLAVVGTEGGQYQSVTDWLQQFVEYPVQDLESTITNSRYTGHVSFRDITVMGASGEQTTFSTLYILGKGRMATEGNIFLYFFENGTLTEQEEIAYMDAIGFSSYYG